MISLRQHSGQTQDLPLRNGHVAFEDITFASFTSLSTMSLAINALSMAKFIACIVFARRAKTIHIKTKVPCCCRLSKTNGGPDARTQNPALRKPPAPGRADDQGRRRLHVPALVYLAGRGAY